MFKYLLFFSILLFTACKDKKESPLEKEFKNFLGQKIVFADTMKALCKGEIWKEDRSLAKNFKIISYIDSAECTACSMKHLCLWSNFKAELEKYNICIYIVTRNSDEKTVSEILENLGIDYPVFFDRQGDFEKENHLPFHPALRTFVLDKDDKVVFIGSPVDSRNMWNIFEKTISAKISSGHKNKRKEISKVLVSSSVILSVYYSLAETIRC